MADAARIRKLHLWCQALALAGVVILLWTGREALAAWGMPSDRYAAEFNARLADLEQARVRDPEEIRAKVRFLEEHLPHQLELEGTFLRLGTLVALMLILPVGVGAFLHRSLSVSRQGAQAEALRLLGRIEAALAAVAALAVLAALLAASAARSEAETKAGRIARLVEVPEGRDVGLLADLTREAYKRARDGNRAVKTASAVILTSVAFSLALGVFCYVSAFRYLK